MGSMNSVISFLFFVLVLRTLVVHGDKGNPPAEILSRVKRIIGGDEIEKGEFPYLAFLKGKVPVRFFFGIPVAYRRYYCSGSVIDKRWILTAAHCFKQRGYPRQVMTPRYWHIKVGEIKSDTSIFSRLKSLVGRRLNKPNWVIWNLHASHIVVHPHYDERENWKHDVALLQLEEDLPVDTDEHIGTIALPSSYDTSTPADGDICIMKGWGCTGGGRGLEETAHAVNLPKVADEQCASMYRINTATRLCAGENFAGTGICNGDSGGPLVCKQAGRWYQAGVASFTSANSPHSYPGAFTRVDYYANWIRDTIAAYSFFIFQK